MEEWVKDNEDRCHQKQKMQENGFSPQHLEKEPTLQTHWLSLIKVILDFWPLKLQDNKYVLSYVNVW